MVALIDAHQHFIYRDVAGHRWTNDIPELANRSFSLEYDRALTADADIISTIFMETGVDDADFRNEIRFAARLAGTPTNRIAGLIASCRPERDAGFAEWLDECGHLNVAGFRRVLHIAGDLLSTTETFRRNIRTIGDRGKTLDLCFHARKLPVAIELARACENTTLVVDHCGVPGIAGGALARPYRGTCPDAACFFCKLAGLLAYCAPGQASRQSISPYVDHVLEMFGANRIVRGSDWPVVNLGGGLPA